MIRQVEIIAVGTELLLGTTANTNATWLAQQLSLLGLSSRYQIVVGDNYSRLKDQIETSLRRSDCIILTGGLGPTADDITMKVAADVAGADLAFHEESWERILKHFEQSGRVPKESNRSQVMLPAGQTVLPNENGTAPGSVIAFTYMNRPSWLILLPGPPMENRPMFSDYVRPFLEGHSEWKMIHRFLRLIGIGESDAEAAVMDLIEGQTDTTIAPYAHAGEMLFRLTRRYSRDPDPVKESQSAQEAVADLDRISNEIRKRLGEYVYAVGDISLPRLVCNALLQNNLTFGFAESLTAGMAAAEAADVPGISKVFRGGLITYQDETKKSLLGIDQSLLDQASAVSGEIAEAMALAARRIMNCDYAVALTGLAGPGTDDQGRDAGLTYISAAGPGGVRTNRFVFTGDRTKIRQIAALNAYNELRISLLEDGVPGLHPEA